jgi:hypothetical protein
VVVVAGDDAHVLENMLWFANHIILGARTALGQSQQCRKSGRVPIMRIGQYVSVRNFFTKPDGAKRT